MGYERPDFEPGQLAMLDDANWKQFAFGSKTEPRVCVVLGRVPDAMYVEYDVYCDGEYVTCAWYELGRI